MTATRLDLTIEQGADDFTPFPAILDSSGNPVDITNASAALQVRTQLGDPTALLTLTTANSGLIPSAGGIWLPSIAQAVTSALQAGVYVYDLKMIDISGKTTRKFQGLVYVPAQVTLIILTSDGGAILLEDGSNMLQEDGTKILTEDSSSPSSGDMLLESGGNMLQEDGSKILTEG